MRRLISAAERRPVFGPRGRAWRSAIRSRSVAAAQSRHRLTFSARRLERNHTPLRLFAGEQCFNTKLVRLLGRRAKRKSMTKIIAIALASALASITLAPIANAQSGQDTNTNRGGATTGSGQARPDATTGASGGAPAAPSMEAAPTQGSTSGSGQARPDTSSSGASGAPEASSPKKATGTQNQ